MTQPSLPVCSNPNGHIMFDGQCADCGYSTRAGLHLAGCNQAHERGCKPCICHVLVHVGAPAPVSAAQLEVALDHFYPQDGPDGNGASVTEG